MSSIDLSTLAAYTNELLNIDSIPDYPPALNGVQCDHHGPVTRIAAAVDCSLNTIEQARDNGANLLIVHHGLFWNGLQSLVGSHLARVRALLQNDIALYSAHLPLDCHDTFGNSALLARQLGLTPTRGFARYQHIDCGVGGDSDLPTTDLIKQVTDWAAEWGHHTVSSNIPKGHRTRRWAICSGAGAQVENLREAYQTGVDTLIVGEGPHWSAIDAEEHGLVIIYAGHYATETLGVKALAAHIADRYGLPWSFLHAPTGL